MGLSGSMTLVDEDNSDGSYEVPITLSAANGFEVGKSYRAHVVGTVGGVTGATDKTWRVGVVLTAQPPTSAAIAAATRADMDANSTNLNLAATAANAASEKLGNFTGGDTVLSFLGEPVGANLSADIAAAKAAAEAAETAAEAAGAGTRDTRDLDPVDHVWNLRRSGDGTWRSTNKLIVHPGDTWRAGWNCDVRAILPQGKVISAQGDPELVTATDDITLADPAIGHDATVPKVEFEVAADAVAGETHWIKTEVTAQNASGPKTVYGEVEVQAEPE
jgi:hypothetical protein